jgi:hypothetical protein
MEILIGRNGCRIAAFKEEQVRALLKHEILTSGDLFWFEGRESWEPLSNFPEVLPHSISPPAAVSTTGGAGKVILAGYICSAISILLAPLLFGIAGLVLGILALRRGATGHGTAIIALSVTCSVSGFLLGMVML